MPDAEIRAKILEVQTAAEKLMELYRTCLDTAQAAVGAGRAAKSPRLEVDAAELVTHAQRGHALAAQMSEACNEVTRALDS